MERVLHDHNGREVAIPPDARPAIFAPLPGSDTGWLWQTDGRSTRRVWVVPLAGGGWGVLGCVTVRRAGGLGWTLREDGEYEAELTVTPVRGGEPLPDDEEG